MVTSSRLLLAPNKLIRFSTEDKKPGLLFRAVNYLFKSTKLKSENENMKFTIRLSAIELYNEQCFDLLTTGHARMKPLQVSVVVRNALLILLVTSLCSDSRDPTQRF